MACAIAVTSLSLVPLASTSTGAAGASSTASWATSSSAILAARATAPEKCPSARGAVRFYQRRLNEWRAKMGAPTTTPVPAAHGCPRYLSHLLQRKSRAARRAYERWYAYHYDWRSWLPAKWFRIARCETGVHWEWNSGTYQGAFGFYHASWDAFRLPGYPSEAYLATPRQQYEVALAIYRRYGLSGWGCRNA